MDLSLFPGLGPRGDGVGLLIGHVRQPGGDVAEVLEGIDLQAPAVFDDRHEDRTVLLRFRVMRIGLGNCASCCASFVVFSEPGALVG